MCRKYITNFEFKNIDYNFYDVIIIGTGISGLLCALNISQEKKVLIISKSDLNMSNSSLAQGGIAASIDQKNKESHIEDTLKAGCYINDDLVVNKIINSSNEVIDNLINFGVEFDKDEYGNILFTKEGGHSERRILHCKDQTGEKIINALINKILEYPNVYILENTFALDILSNGNSAYGLIIKERKKDIDLVLSDNIVLASGGIGKIFKNTTNSSNSTGDGIAMAIRLGAKLKDMEFVQFHPTAFNLNIEDGFLISEAVRGEGGKLVNSLSEDFMSGVHILKELAPRDIVAQAIFREMQDGKSVFLDITHKSKEYIEGRFPKIYNHCLKFGIDMSKDLVPIAPVQHYFMGGIYVDNRGRTSLKGLYAIGECSNTGAHGANRLASNSLLESATYGLIVSREINSKLIDKRVENLKEFDEISYRKLLSLNDVKEFDLNCISDKKVEIQDIMSKYVSIEKTKVGLKYAYNKILQLENEFDGVFVDDIEFYETINILAVAKEIIKSSLSRELSIGSHIIIDRSL